MDVMKISGSPQVQASAVAPKVAEVASKPAEPIKLNVDSVQISSAGQQALQEAKETTAQTAQEARNGDPQAQRLLAREHAEQPKTATPLEGAEK